MDSFFSDPTTNGYNWRRCTISGHWWHHHQHQCQWLQLNGAGWQENNAVTFTCGQVCPPAAELCQVTELSSLSCGYQSLVASPECKHNWSAATHDNNAKKQKDLCIDRGSSPLQRSELKSQLSQHTPQVSQMAGSINSQHLYGPGQYASSPGKRMVTGPTVTQSVTVGPVSRNWVGWSGLVKY